MSNRTLGILVIISLSFNLAFLSMFFFHLLRGPLPPGIGHDFKIPPRFRDYFIDSREDIKPLRHDFENSRKDFMIALSDPEFDENRLLDMLDLAVDRQMIMEKELGIKLIQLRKQMTPNEAEKFFGNPHPLRENLKNSLEIWKKNKKRR